MNIFNFLYFYCFSLHAPHAHFLYITAKVAILYNNTFAADQFIQCTLLYIYIYIYIYIYNYIIYTLRKFALLLQVAGLIALHVAAVLAAKGDYA